MDEKLHTGVTPWQNDISPPPLKHQLESIIKADVTIIGAGITGAFLAEIFSRAGQKVVVVDKHIPETASTMASTALLLWEIDAPLTELAEQQGLEKAMLAYTNSFKSVRYIADLVNELSLNCGFKERRSLYLQGDKLDAKQLRDEFDLRKKQGFPCEWLSEDDVARNYGFTPRCAIRSDGCAEVHPVLLAQGLLKASVSRGAQILSPFEATSFDSEGSDIRIALKDTDTCIISKTLIFATGYEIPDHIACPQHSIVSTWAIGARTPNAKELWLGDDIVWEASEAYAYMRRWGDNGIIFGGEDEPISDAEARDYKLKEKTRTLYTMLRQYIPDVELAPQCAWAAFFGTTQDALPLIGRVAALPNTWAAWGYGGNGITYSALAAQLIFKDVLDGQAIDTLYALNR